MPDFDSTLHVTLADTLSAYTSEMHVTPKWELWRAIIGRALNYDLIEWDYYSRRIPYVQFGLRGEDMHRFDVHTKIADTLRHYASNKDTIPVWGLVINQDFHDVDLVLSVKMLADYNPVDEIKAWWQRDLSDATTAEFIDQAFSSAMKQDVEKTKEYVRAELEQAWTLWHLQALFLIAEKYSPAATHLDGPLVLEWTISIKEAGSKYMYPTSLTNDKWDVLGELSTLPENMVKVIRTQNGAIRWPVRYRMEIRWLNNITVTFPESWETYQYVPGLIVGEAIQQP